MASSATRWVRWRIKVKAHVLVLICPFTACCGSLWVAVGALVASAPGVQAEEDQQRYTSRTTPHVTCVTRHAQNAKPTSRCRTVAPWSIPLHHGAPRCDGCYHPETDGEKLVRTGINGCSAMAHPLTHLTHGIPTRRPFHPAKRASLRGYVVGSSLLFQRRPAAAPPDPPPPLAAHLTDHTRPTSTTPHPRA